MNPLPASRQRPRLLALGSVLLLASAAAQVATPAATPAAGIIAELRANHAADALRDADLALRDAPGNAQLWILKGVAARQLDQPEVALSAFQAALRLAPTSLPALEGASEISYRIDRPTAHALVARLLAIAPDQPQANGMAGMLDVERADWAAAITHFSKAGPAIAQQKGALAAQVTALDHLGRDPEAEAVLEHMTQLWPDDPTPRYNLGILHLRDKQPGLALAALQPLLAKNDGPALSLASGAYEQQGDTPRAVEALRSAIQANPKEPRNYLDFASLSFDHSSFAAGITMLNAGLSQLPDSAALHIARGVLYMQSSQTKQAEQDFETANQLDPAQTLGREAQGLTEMQRHNLPQALATVEASLRQTPGNAYLHFLAAEILKEEGATPGSPEQKQELAYAERAVALDPTLVPALDLLSSLRFQAGDYPAAAALCRAALRQDPNDQEALFRLVLALRRTGDPQKEIAGLLENLKQAKAQDHDQQARIDRYRLVDGPSNPSAPPAR